MPPTPPVRHRAYPAAAPGPLPFTPAPPPRWNHGPATAADAPAGTGTGRIEAIETTGRIEALAVEGLLLSSAARAAGTTAAVPACPGRQARGLLRHTGVVTTFHRVDAESARGGELPAAADGVDEPLDRFRSSERSKVRSAVPRRLRLRATDTGARWTVRLSSGPPQVPRAVPSSEVTDADRESSGTAEQLHLTPWNRLPFTALAVTGDPEPARIWRENSGIAWS